MSCTLNRLTTYNAGRIIHDNLTGVYTVQLVNPPTNCPDTVFTSKKVEVRVIEGSNPELTFNVVKGIPMITVPRSEYVEQIGSASWGFGTYLIIALSLGFLGLIFMARRNKRDDDIDFSSFSSDSGGSFSSGD